MYECLLIPDEEYVLTIAGQAFFSLRLYRLLYRAYYAIACWILTLLSFAFTLTVMVLCNTNVSLTAFTIQWYWLIAATLGLYAVTDIAITAGLCWTLWNARSNAVNKYVRPL